MNNGNNPYRVDTAAGVRAQVDAIKDAARIAGKLDQFVRLFKEGIRRLRTDPLGWGDPEYRSKYGSGLHCHGILRPLAFRFVVFDQIRGVLLLSVEQIAEY